MNNNDLRTAVLLSIQRALLGNLGTRVRLVTCRWSTHDIKIRAVFDGAIPDHEAEAMSVAETEMMADFPDHDVSLTCERCDAPQNIPREADDYAVFRRFES
jgi:hypothetical protein